MDNSPFFFVCLANTYIILPLQRCVHQIKLIWIHLGWYYAFIPFCSCSTPRKMSPQKLVWLLFIIKPFPQLCLQIMVGQPDCDVSPTLSTSPFIPILPAPPFLLPMPAVHWIVSNMHIAGSAESDSLCNDYQSIYGSNKT